MRIKVRLRIRVRLRLRVKMLNKRSNRVRSIHLWHLHNQRIYKKKRDGGGELPEKGADDGSRVEGGDQ